MWIRLESAQRALELLLGPRTGAAGWCAKARPHDPEEDVVVVWNLRVYYGLRVFSEPGVGVCLPADQFEPQP
jgi:hypothetical protein